jgi:uncharacterized protein (DUF2235 family)
MSKSIIFCADGTWQLPRNNTNVYQLYKGLITSATQIALYDDGVGADATGLQRIQDGVLGDSILQKVKDGYTQIAHVYEPGDSIYTFGFSRGAYTARSLAGMIAVCGLPAGGFDSALVDQAFAAYRDPVNRATILAGLAKYQLQNCTIQMVGVWDTVGALGVPAIFGGVDLTQYGFLDTSLHPNVQHACHCMSIDEERKQFPATLWTSAPVGAQTIDQVWFCGCHGDVGGGTEVGGGVDDTTMLSDITLSWMVGKAAAFGVVFDPGFLAQCTAPAAKYSLDLIHESWKVVFGPPVARPIAANATLSNSVQVRVQFALDYLPSNLKITTGALDPGYTQVNVVDMNNI